MSTVIVVIHLLLAVALVTVILLQKSEGGALGIGGGGGMSGFMTGRSTANLLTRTTAILAAAFMITSLTLAVMASRMTGGSIIDTVPAAEETVPQELPKNAAPAKSKATTAPASKTPSPAVPKPE